MCVKLLIVDDQEIVRRSLSLLFETQDEIEVVGFAESGEQAIEQTQALQPDIVLMDLGMPGMGGVEATRQIHEISPFVKIIILTAMRGKDWAQHCMKAGAASYVQKDIPAEKLVDLILAHAQVGL